MTDRIFLVTGTNTLEPLDASPYENEAVFQEFVERYPDLLAGDQMNSASPRRWLLIKREMGVPDKEGGCNRWSIDHLFLDQDGIPTLVEIKRAQDTRIRREVVGQVLDYAANAVLHWPIDVIRTSYEQTTREAGLDPRQTLLDFLKHDDSEMTTETEDPTAQFWSTTKTNLEAGRIRLVFVADEIPTELENIVSFLNKQMDPCEALAVEMKQYVGNEVRTIAPRVLGQTPESRARKSTRATGDTHDWDELTFLEALQQKHGTAEEDLARRIIEHVRLHVHNFYWGTETVNPTCMAFIESPKIWNLLGIWHSGSVAMRFKSIRHIPPFDQDEAQEELRSKLNEISDWPIEHGFLDRYHEKITTLSSMINKGTADKYLQTLDWIRNQVSSHAN